MYFQIDLTDERVKSGGYLYGTARDWLRANDIPDDVMDRIDPTRTMAVYDWPGGCREIVFTVNAVDEQGKYYLCRGECPCGEAHHVAQRIVAAPLTVSAPDTLRPVMSKVHEDAVAS